MTDFELKSTFFERWAFIEPGFAAKSTTEAYETGGISTIRTILERELQPGQESIKLIYLVRRTK
ncbi:MAG TPA: hypothetical protein VFB34_06165 [Chloroflexota bacterium]|nr:hypothetical protein [Chloroflexota bacterium]